MSEALTLAARDPDELSEFDEIAEDRADIYVDEDEPAEAELCELRERERRHLLQRSAQLQLGESFLRWQGTLAAARRYGVDSLAEWTEGESAIDELAGAQATFSGRALDADFDASAFYATYSATLEAARARVEAATRELEAGIQRAVVARARGRAARPMRASLVRALATRVPRARETRARRVSTAARAGPSDSDSDPPRADDVEDELGRWLATTKAGDG